MFDRLSKFLLPLLSLPIFAAVSVCAWPPAQDDLNAKLTRHISNYSLTDSNLPRALIRVSNDFHIPMGIVWIMTPTQRSTPPVAWKNATVQEIIEAIAKTHVGYEVQVRNGVVHVSPSGLIPNAQNFLTMKIDRFHVHNDYIEMASFKLHNLITPPGFAGFSVGATGDSRVDVEFKDATVENILDGLLAASNRKIWIVTFSDETGLTSRGFRKTKSLFTEAPVPDKEQPVWDLLRWRDPMPAGAN